MDTLYIHSLGSIIAVQIRKQSVRRGEKCLLAVRVLHTTPVIWRDLSGGFDPSYFRGLSDIILHLCHAALRTRLRLRYPTHT